MTKDNFENELPEGYELKIHIDAAKDKKLMAIYIVLSCLPVLIIVAAAALLLFFVRGWSIKGDFIGNFIALLVAVIVSIVYIVLHELTHGITYKILTGAKLRFGLTWNVAFCGVPDIFVYRKAMKIAVLMPFIIYTVIFAGLTAAMYFVGDAAFLGAALVFGLHLGGCVGDLHVTYVLDHKFTSSKMLVRDTGPEQFFYIYTGKGKIQTEQAETFDKVEQAEQQEQTNS
ncbi:MAG: DUF3267 domain-containing protein [Clostridia bacterium]|nr:DUF3267 domain-containing protein [Clostridia bacterium]